MTNLNKDFEKELRIWRAGNSNRLEDLRNLLSMCGDFQKEDFITIKRLLVLAIKLGERYWRQTLSDRKDNFSTDRAYDDYNDAVRTLRHLIVDIAGW